MSRPSEPWRDDDGERRWGENDEEWQGRQARGQEKRQSEIPTPRPCRVCGNTFTPLIAYYERCPECCRRANELMGRAPAKIETKPCAICGAAFTAPAHWKRCNGCRKAGRTLATERGAYRSHEPGRFPSVDELHRVGVSVLDYGVLRCDHCGTTWETIARAGEPLSDGYWRCPHGCNAKGGTP